MIVLQPTNGAAYPVVQVVGSSIWSLASGTLINTRTHITCRAEAKTWCFSVGTAQVHEWDVATAQEPLLVRCCRSRLELLMSMSNPSEPILRGVDWEMQVTIRDEDNDVVDMTQSGRSLLLRFRVPGETTIAFSRASGTSTDFTWTSQSGGVGKWIFLSDDTDLSATTGTIHYDVDCYYVNTAASPDEYRFLGTAKWVVRDPPLGSLS